ncbi:MAG: LysR substrate-binding domain-containing protein, partial [Adlercreutzia equolifaciens]
MPGIGLPTELKLMNMRLFLRERIVATIHEDNALAGCETLALEQLAGEPLVVLDDRAEGFSRMNEEILRFFTQRGCAPCDIRRTEQIETLGLKLSECKGYALTPASLQFPHRDYLRAIPLEEED